jgi:hypothetical protein
MYYYIAVMIIMYFLGKMLAPKVRNAVPQTPTGVIAIDNTQCIPVLFGTRELLQPNCVWYCGLRTTPIYASGGGGK